MKKFVYILVLFLTISNFGICGELQNQYEKQNALDTEIFTKIKASYLIKNDYEGYMNGAGSMYGVLLNLYEKSDEANYQYLAIIKKNFETCRDNIKNWKYVDVDDYTYKFLDDDTKRIILFNNTIYANK